jgi:hypothetical protein
MNWHAVHCVLRIVKYCSDIFDHSVRILSITAVLGSHDIVLRIWLGLQGGCRISTGREDFAGGSGALPTLRKGLEIKLSYSKAESAMLRGDYMAPVVEIVICGVPTVLEVR